MTVYCRNAIVYYDDANGNKDRAIKLKGYGHAEFTAEGNHQRNIYQVVEDGCSVSSWHLKLNWFYTVDAFMRKGFVRIAKLMETQFNRMQNYTYWHAAARLLDLCK